MNNRLQLAAVYSPPFVLIQHIQVTADNGAALSLGLDFGVCQRYSDFLCIPLGYANLQCSALQVGRVDVDECHDTRICKLWQKHNPRPFSGICRNAFQSDRQPVECTRKLTTNQRRFKFGLIAHEVDVRTSLDDERILVGEGEAPCHVGVNTYRSPSGSSVTYITCQVR